MKSLYKKEQLSEILDKFGIQLLNYKSHGSIYKQRAVFRIETDSGTFSLKPFSKNLLSQLSATQQMKKAAELVQILIEAGYPYIPKWLTTKSGRYYIRNKGRPIYLMEWVKGESLEAVEDYMKLGQAMAALHTTANHLLTAKESYTLMQIELLKMQERLFRQRSDISRFTYKFKRWFKKHRDQCIQLSNAAWNTLNDPEVQAFLATEPDRPSIVHGDITSPNVIISNDQLYIIDWDRVRVDSIYIELVKTLTNTTNFNPVSMEAILRGYEERKPLHPIERKIIVALFRLPREAWYVYRFPNLKKSNVMLDILEQTWPSRLEAIGWIEAWANQERGNV